MTAETPAKPDRTYTKRQTIWNVVACWVALFGSMALGRDMAAIVVPIMATLIAALVGVYQTIGHFDLRALATLAAPRAGRSVRAHRPPRPPEEVQP